MAHQLDSLNGRTTFAYAKQAPWHGLGVHLGDELVTSAEMIKAAQLDWTVEKKPLFADLSDEGDGAVSSRLHKVHDKVALFRDVDGKYLSIVGDQYGIVQNIDAFNWTDELIASKAVKYETAGALDEGRRVFMLAKLPDSLRVGGFDIVDKYLLVTNSHDTTGAMRAFFTTTRVVCANTLRVATNGQDNGIALRHTAHVKQRLDQAGSVLSKSLVEFDRFQSIADLLLAKQVTGVQVKELVREVFPASNPLEPSTRAKNMWETVITMFERGSGNDDARMKGSAWALLNAVTEFTTHVRGRNGMLEDRVESSWFGSADRVNQQTVQRLLAIA